MIISFQESAKKDLRKIDKQVVLRILKNIQKLEDYPDIANVKKLKNHYPPQRFRIGDYRVLFDIVDNEIIVINIKHRREAYI